MSNLKWKGLRDLDCGGLRDLGDAWKSHATAMADETQRIRDAVVKGHLSVDNYESDTADQVREQLRLMADRFEDDLSDYAEIRLATGLLEAADALEAEQKEIAELATLIQSRGFEIHGDPREYWVEQSEDLRHNIESMTPPQWLLDRAGFDDAYLAVTTNHMDQVIRPLRSVANEQAGEYQDWLRAVMSRAHDADNDAAAMLSAMRENPPGLPPHFGPTYDRLLDDYKNALSQEVVDEMRAIADGESGLSPEQINQWWEGLSDAERAALLDAHPEWIGPTDGIPVETRDTANRVLLDNDIASLDDKIAEMEAELDGIERKDSAAYLMLQEDLEAIKGERDDLQRLQNHITDSDGNPAAYSETGQQYYLLGFDTEGSGQAIVSIGNPDTAANVNAYVPGTGSDLAGASGTLMDRTETMARDAQRRGAGEETATVLWLGYDAPDNVVPEAADAKWAEQASSDLEQFTQGIRATAEGDPANVTLTGHSYGTTVIGTAAASEGVHVDNLVFVASPGVGVDTVDALGMDQSNVWATRNDKDIIQYGLVHGQDPTTARFGGNDFHSEATSAGAKANHSTYWDDHNMDARDFMGDIYTGSR
jgi:pimeloyl-ACP methyl ester carboxylesterase